MFKSAVRRKKRLHAEEPLLFKHRQLSVAYMLVVVVVLEVTALLLILIITSEYPLHVCSPSRSPSWSTCVVESSREA